MNQVLEKPPIPKSPELKERGVEFGSAECCALREAFDHNSALVEDLNRLFGPDGTTIFSRLFHEDLDRTERLNYIPSEQMKQAYQLLATAEQTRLADPNALLGCHHIQNKQEHLVALNNILSQLQRVMEKTIIQ